MQPNIKSHFTNNQLLVKRIFDILVSVILLPFAIPLMIIISIAIAISSKGPIIFKQARVGEKGKLFQMYKFRSMYEGTEEEYRYVNSTEDFVPIKIKDDPEITGVGKILRKSSLDELPQILNVLKGDMSLVGPRPELPYIVDKYEDWQYRRLAVPQGITGWWQVSGRADKPMHLHTEDDLFYIDNYSFWLDIKIMTKTIGAVYRGKGAY